MDSSSTPVTSAAAEPGPTHTRAPRSVEKEFKSILELGIEVLKHGEEGVDKPCTSDFGSEPVSVDWLGPARSVERTSLGPVLVRREEP